MRHGGGESLAFNDAVLARVPGEGMVEATLSVSGRRYGHYRCDALILATPMGSTAYSYAAGGPVVSPGAEGILVTPSAPLNGIAPQRPARARPSRCASSSPAAARPSSSTACSPAGSTPGRCWRSSWRPDAGRLVRIDGSRAADRSRVKLSLLDLPLLPRSCWNSCPRACAAGSATGDPAPT